MTDTPNGPSLERSVREVVRHIYSHVLADLGLDTGKLRAFLYGGRSMGRSVLLGILAEDADIDADRPRDVLEGKGGDNVYARLCDHASALRGGEPVVDLYLDDVDHLLVHLLRNEQPESVETVETTLRDLNFLLSKVPATRGRFVLTSALSPSRLSDVLDARRWQGFDTGLLTEFFSFVLEQKYECNRLDPWHHSWEKRLEQLVLKRLPKARDEYRQSCATSIRELTGGHPALLVRSLHELGRLATSEEGLASALSDDPQLELRQFTTLFERHLEDELVRTGLQPLRLSIRNLRHAREPDLAEAWESLVELAHGSSQTPALRVREILIDEGLIYRDTSTGAYVVPGELVIREVLTGSTGSSHPPILLLESDPAAPETRGQLVIRSGLRRDAIELTDSMWIILELLFDEPDRILPPSEIQARSRLSSEAAVRSAIQRLTAKLRDGGVDGVIENVYGKGYRKGSEPRYTAK